MNFEFYLLHYNYWVSVILFMIGLYAMIAKENLIKKFMGLNIVETSIFLFYISMADKADAIAPVLYEYDQINVDQHANPLPSIIILTAIVIALAITATALALIIRIYEEYGTLNASEIEELW
ncbi:cation:proton antiporter subunit C [Methanonatronarchaeum sp. AMET6-2]|uniref:cation:proton antiporter subunit C n=1 Tax=Methanonatronarchaeum sp. AMET6-2 TaxID=2933293 RepID=UPI00121AAE38|nr:cation:proton antiporter subunit C [Methanonatronarchaeum sp. AMET6-2]RZN62242.1 MAG: Na+/H+ antiporter subunit C [Methanonatronarchaeia archaeon]UOY10422.1 cation:proton antiporter subunit C [Methanonatronarchaeum sp. AMET6-2]